jgi:predicted nuclease of predicted toxin-antitoxin system
MDEHIPSVVTIGLRRRGVDVLTAQEAGLLATPDLEHLTRACAGGRVLVTQDADFVRLHRSGIPHCGIIYAPGWTTIGAFVHSLMLIHDLLDVDSMANRLEFILSMLL